MPLMQVSNACPMEAVWACRSFIISGQLVLFHVRLNGMPFPMALARTITSHVGRVLKEVASVYYKVICSCVPPTR